MANDEHVAILKKSVEAWNKWRRKDEISMPILQRADFAGADLRGANLERTNPHPGGP
jgi:uncharacterized protein YjbI with pentapeptide repeats